MGKFHGHRCDLDSCGRAEENPDPSKHAAPPGWIIVDPQSPDGKKFEFCSAKCNAKWATERAKFEKVVGVRNVSEEGKQRILEGNLRRWHREGAHDAEPNPECPDCQAVTAPTP